ncbi:class I adenylate-forming enzyme family protein [Xenorhabdus sp. PB62.4]|uniref:class I adenylate-forming enzyme family protein n=1 Tax=Xenorhabdus sp. PB62.4 TaxID=1851573 RepID=UPI00165704F4|nr:class I adenylate-forming enzyme family protein [Xenorhabdus sp. PB62.4]MBC8953951.1 long-chain-fatty-acid--CoA ligase [Xenorhabdus sp. PB62.4]
MYEHFLKTVNENINNIAINSEKRIITYGKLNEYVNELAFLLKNIGITNSTCVGLFSLNSTLHIISVLALSKIKAKIIFFHPKMTEEEFNKVKFIDPEYIIYDENDTFKIDNFIYSTHHIEFLDLYLISYFKYKKHQIEYQNDIIGDIVFLSSGSTGYYKVIVKTEKQILTEKKQIISTLDIKKSDKIVCSAQLCHSYGFMFGMIVPLLTGSEITYTDPIILVSSLEKILKKNTIFVGLPTHYRLLCNYSNQTFRNIKIALSGGSNIKSKEQEKIKLLGFKISNIYGMSETGALMIENNHHNSLLPTHPYRPITGVEIKLDYSETYNYFDQFSYEIIVKTDSLCSYIIDNGITKKNHFGQWFPTGDLAVKNGGKLHIVGRKDLTINVGGKKINPFEIESVLKEHPNVNEAVVYGISDIKRGQIPIAIVEVNKKTDLTELFDLCHKKLSEYKIPKRIEIKDYLPTSSIGKTLRKLN